MIKLKTVKDFDIIPVKNAEPEFAHQGEVVRKKADRKQLEGWQCHECEQWYEAEDLNPEEKKMMMNKCSRHKSKYNPLRNTPKNFWNPDWIDEG
ncbi:DNA endonuclease RBBP8-like [Homarus americanus]|uniref:DNA endonuclease RBBP8-like n=1 Tax=Homarus americanus TaxID=6706 RepID=A0A8J5TNH2_HOMAM|nr:DNA endonuclease RBBP8-like [Homarus americanus]